MGLAAWRAGVLEPFGFGRPGAVAQRGAGGGPAGDGDGAGPTGEAGEGVFFEASDAAVPTTVKEYTFKPAEKLPPVKYATIRCVSPALTLTQQASEPPDIRR